MKRISCFFVVFTCFCILLLLGGCSNKPTNENDLQQDVDNVQSQIDDLIKENNKDGVGTYVMPDESCFTWEDVTDGVAITAYSGTEKAVIIPETLGGSNVVDIKSGAFNSAGILGIKLPNTLISISDQAFYFCTTLNEVYFGSAITNIGSQAFEGCLALSFIEFNSSLNIIGSSAFGNCQLLSEIVLPESLEVIGEGSFCMSGIKNVSIPGSVETIGDQAFTCCNSLETVEINSGVQSIGKKAFETCSALKEVTIPASVTEIGLRAFNQCENITIIAPAGSQGEAYANENSITFKAL